MKNGDVSGEQPQRTELDDTLFNLLTVTHDTVKRIKPVLAGLPADVQGLVLADCLAIWLAGYDIPGDKEAVRRLRAELLGAHNSQVLRLIPIVAKTIGTTP